MLFSSVTFLYYFLPAFLILYFAVPGKLKNTVILLGSLFFYAWGEPVYVLLMLGSTLAAYLLGLVIEKFRGKPLSRAAMIASVVIGIGLLGVFKYADFFISSFNAATGLSLSLLRIALPIGISFYTFQILSYTIDLYRGRAEVQKNPINFAAYVTLFPQLIAGPIVRYTDVAAELDSRKHTAAGFTSGCVRFIIGLGKKVLLANTLGELCSIYKSSDEKSVLFAWLYIIAYALHIYFDFSGYSDMAIGLGRILGFNFPENFNYPYISASITEFWRRWHISLGSWFRDYVYIPLGGNRCGTARHIFNILVVWLLTGLWHGAGWTFVAWGLYFALFLLLEKFVIFRYFKNIPKAVMHLYTVVVLLLGWVLFDASSLAAALSTVGLLFGIGGSFAGGDVLYYLRSYGLLLIVGIIGATPLPKLLADRLSASRARGAMTVLEPIAVAAVLLVCTAYLVDGSYNPFIYFRF